MAEFDPQQLAQLSQMALQQYGLQHQESMYRPRFGLSNPMAGGTGTFSFAQRLGSNFGQGGQTLGMMADIGLPLFFQSQGQGQLYTDFMQRLQVAQGGNLAQMYRAREYQGLVQNMGMGDVAGLINRELGLTGGSAAFVEQAAPIVDLLTNGAVTDFARLFDQNLMTQQGAMSVIAAQRRLNFGRIDAASSRRLQSQMRDMARINAAGDSFAATRRRDPNASMRGFDFRDNTLTGGFNLDEAAELLAVASDLDVRDLNFANSFSDADLRIDAQREFAERSRAGTIGTDTVDSIMRARRDNLALIGGMSQLGQIQQTMRATFGGDLSVGQMSMMMREMGMTPTSQGNVGEIQELIRQLGALGQAAGMTTEQMLESGRIMQRQFGGSAAFHIASVGAAQSAMGLFGRSAADAGSSMDIGMSGRMFDTVAQRNMGTANAPIQRLLAAGLADPETRGRIMAAMDNPQAMSALLQDLAANRQDLVAGGMRLTNEQVAAASGLVAQRMGVGQFTTAMLDVIADRQEIELGRTGIGRVNGREVDGRPFFTTLEDLNEREMQVLLSAVNNPEGAAGLDADDRQVLDQIVARGGGGARASDLIQLAQRNETIRSIIGTRATIMGFDATSVERQRSVTEQRVAEIIQQGVAGPQGMANIVRALTDTETSEGDLVSRLSSVEGVTGFLEDAGLLRRGGEHSALRAILGSDPDLRSRVSSDLIRLRRAAMARRRFGAGDNSPEAQAAEAEYQSARQALQRYGVQEGSEVAEETRSAVRGANLMESVGSWLESGYEAVRGLGETLWGSGTDASAGSGAQNDEGNGQTSGADGATTARVDVELNFITNDERIVVSRAEAQDSGAGVRVRANTARRDVVQS